MFCAFDRKTVPIMIMMIAMIIMIVLMIIWMIIMAKITKKHTNNMTFQQKCTNFRDYYLVKTGPINSGMGKPSPPTFGQCPKVSDFFNGCLPLDYLSRSVVITDL